MSLSVQLGVEVAGVWAGDRDGLSQPEVGRSQSWALPSEKGNTWQGCKVSSISAQLGYVSERTVELRVKPNTFVTELAFS